MYAKRFLSILCCAVSIGLFAFIVSTAISTEITSRTETSEIVSKIDRDNPVGLVLSYVYNNNLEKAKEIFSQKDFYDSCNGDENLYHYFENFFDYADVEIISEESENEKPAADATENEKNEANAAEIAENVSDGTSENLTEEPAKDVAEEIAEETPKEEKKSIFDKAKNFVKDVNEKKDSAIETAKKITNVTKNAAKNAAKKEEEKSIQDAIYFITANYNVEKYFSNLGCKKVHAFRISEIIPYYVAKNYVQKQKNYSEIYLFAKEYKDLFTKFDSITKETADVLCLYFYAEYENKSTRDKKDFLKSEINEINAVETRYANSLVDSQKDYISNISKFLQRKENSLIQGNPAQLTKIGDRLENCPKYSF